MSTTSLIRWSPQLLGHIQSTCYPQFLPQIVLGNRGNKHPGCLCRLVWRWNHILQKGCEDHSSVASHPWGSSRPLARPVRWQEPWDLRQENNPNNLPEWEPPNYVSSRPFELEESSTASLEKTGCPLKTKRNNMGDSEKSYISRGVKLPYLASFGCHLRRKIQFQKPAGKCCCCTIVFCFKANRHSRLEAELQMCGLKVTVCEISSKLCLPQ